jgi:hypothetical protein
MFLALIVCLVTLSACAAPAPIADTSKPTISVSFGYADGLRYSPSYAVWIEDESGNTATLFATAKAATGLENRPAALPVWKGVSEADVTSGATPNKEAALTMNIPDAFAGKKLNMFIEANASYDFNDFYAEGLSVGDAGYNDVNGQPSVIWTTELDTSASGSATPALTGTGNVLGADHELKNPENITTAAELLTNIEVKWETGNLDESITAQHSSSRFETCCSD